MHPVHTGTRRTSDGIHDAHRKLSGALMADSEAFQSGQKRTALEGLVSNEPKNFKISTVFQRRSFAENDERKRSETPNPDKNLRNGN